MQKYKQYCPVARASEIPGDRWTPLIVRELILGSHRFNEIERGLRDLALAAGVASPPPGRCGRCRAATGCVTKSNGVSPVCSRQRPQGGHRNARCVGCPVGLRRCEARGVGRGVIDLEDSPADQSRALAGQAYGVEFDFTGPRGRRVWLLLEPREVSVCVTPPRFDSDLIIHSDLAFFYRVWLGHIEYDSAIRYRSVVVEGLPVLAKQLPRWFMWSPMARYVRERERMVAHA